MLLDDCITHHARYLRSHTALIWSEGSWTYAELGEMVDRCANVLVESGVRQGDRVAVLSENSPWFLVALFATARIGAIFVPLNYRLSTKELLDNIDDAGICVVFGQDTFLAPLLQAVPAHLGFKAIALQPSPHAPNLPERLATASAAPCAISVNGEDPVLLQYTSGTTGKPKGVLSKHSAWGQSCAIQAPLKHMTAASRFLAILPMCYTGGLKASLEILFAGGTLVIRSRFDAEEVLDQVEEHRITNLYVVPTMLYGLLDAQAAKPRDLSSLRYVNCGGAPLVEARVHQAAEMFKCFLTQGYGMTEIAGGSVSFAGPDDAIRDGVISPKLASVGQPLIDCRVKLVDANGNEVPTGSPGEVLVKTERSLVGYWKQPASARPIDADGYYQTGDIGQFDEDGYLYIVDRKKDMIISGGLNIYSKEVEESLNGHETVEEAYVIGLPDATWGERVHAFIVLKPGEPQDAKALELWCREHLGTYKCPRSFAFVSRASLPVNWSGKVQKRTLRETYLKTVNGDVADTGA